MEATLANAQNSLQEPGIVRFDVVQDHADATRFVLVEVYRDEAATLCLLAQWREENVVTDGARHDASLVGNSRQVGAKRDDGIVAVPDGVFAEGGGAVEARAYALLNRVPLRLGESLAVTAANHREQGCVD